MAIDPHTESEPTGERFVPEVMGNSLIEAEHQVRYRLAGTVAPGRRVLDAGCGVGWGSALLAQAGAAAVVGVDLSEEALDDARRRAPDVRFVQGDLQDLPFEDGDFDLVACFEAIEHVPDPFRALDELRRVLAPGGLLLVSSPNPHVYRAGNPFHVHELDPPELLAEVGKRFEQAELWVQHGHLASVLHRAGTAGGPVPADVVGSSPADEALYSLVVASDGELPAMTGRAALVSSRELDHLEDATEALAEGHRSLAEQWARVAAERDAYLADHERIRAERKRLLDDHATATGEAQVLRDEAAVLRRRLAVAEQEVHRVGADRDRVLLLLLEAEQELARRSSPPPGG